MAPQVGLIGSRSVDQGLQSSNKKTVTDFTFPSPSRTPEEISVPAEGSTDYNGEKRGDCYKNYVEDTHLCASLPSPPRLSPSCRPTPHDLLN
jgi:hypothetical protein